MIITLTIYSLIILYVIGRGFSTSIKKPLCNVQKIESFQNSISLGLMPFYSNMGIINLLCIFINVVLISSFFLPNLINDLFSNNVAYCSDSSSEEKSNSDNDSPSEEDIGVAYYHDSDSSSEEDILNENVHLSFGAESNILVSDSSSTSTSNDGSIDEIDNQSLFLYSDNGGLFERENKIYIKDLEGYSSSKKWGQHTEENIYKNRSYEGILSKLINKTYKISNRENPFVFHLNYEDIQINEPLKIFEGLSDDFDNILNKQNKLIQEIQNQNTYEIGEIQYMYKNIYEKSINMLYLTINAYNKIILFSFYDDFVLKIFNKKLPLENISLIRSYIIDLNQIDILNLKATKVFTTLEKVGQSSKENYNILKEKDNFSIINENIDIKVINIEENIQNQNSKELLTYSNKKLFSISKNNNLNIFFICKNINFFHNQFNDPEYFYGKECYLSFKAIKGMGFLPQSCEESSWAFRQVDSDGNNFSNFMRRPVGESGFGNNIRRYRLDSFDSVERNNMNWD